MQEKEGELSTVERKLRRLEEEVAELSQQGSKEEKEVYSRVLTRARYCAVPHL